MLDSNVFGVPLEMMRNQNAAQILQDAADRMKRRVEVIKQVSSMENFWSVPVKWLKNGELTDEPFDPTPREGYIPYISLKPIRPVIDSSLTLPDPLDSRKMHTAFIRYCDVLREKGSDVPKFDSYLAKIRFEVRHILTRLRII